MADHPPKKQKTTHLSPVDIADLTSRPLPIQRRRVWRACESCRRKKIKCDGHEPVCSQCTQTNSTCTWIQTKDRAATSRHYVQELEARLIQMEGLLTQVGGATELLTADSARRFAPANAPTPASSSPASAHTASYPTLQDSSTYLTDLNVRQPQSDSDQFGQLALDANGHLRWIGGSSAMTLVDAFKNISTAAISGSSTPQGDVSHPRFLAGEGKHPANNLYFPPNVHSNARPRALPGPEEVEFPPRDLADKLVAAYFTHFHHTLPVVDSTAFLSQYRRLMDDHRILSPADTGFPTVVFSVFACAARYVEDPRLENAEPDAHEAGMAHVYYERAMILYYTGHTATQLAHVQAFVLLSSYLASINSLPQSWLLCGQAVRIAQDLGLHRSPRHLSLTPIDKETRRKVWWCVYGLDRMLAVALGRPLGIDDSDCDIELPLDIDDVALPTYFTAGQNTSASPSSEADAAAKQPNLPESPSLMKGFNALTCLFKIAGQVLRQVYAIDKCKENLDPEKMAELQASVDRLDRLLTEWCDKLPTPFKSNPQTSQQVSLGAILCSCYYAVTVTLHRNFIPTSLAASSMPRSSSIPKAVTASRSCIFLAQSIKDVIPSSHWLAFFSQYLFSSAIIILLCVMRATDQGAVTTAMNEVGTAIECLASLEASWPGAKKCKEILKELADITLSKVRETIALSSPAKRDRLTIAAENIMAHSPSAKTVNGAPNASFNTQSATTGSLELRSEARQPTATPRKRTLGAANEPDDNAATHLAGYSLSPSSPASSIQPQHQHLSTPSPLGYGHQTLSSNFSDTISPDLNAPKQYSFGQSPVSPTTPRWSTPHSSGAALCGDTLGPADYSAQHSSSDGLEAAATQSYSFNPSSIPKPQHLDSAYLPFTFPIYEDSASNNAPSPAHFDLSDLPFSGIDFLQSFASVPDSTSGVNEGDPHDSLWSQLSASPFKMGPELPFTLIEGQSLS
ncbi:fungal-specific transcription factor domain-containing protein [Cantharellus anzutake]|uniref:fungal-specific transcription factor domain-containing protein n=1 Tax=Cantharellus anzutake TaxID=1750568 RepID=UPI0019064BF5|nr:fungal-specific transcription factor domain-containing protein [Cantharellus anzutake]KAF8324419.1 fungal-specific transcription factor domain-containing protein [Cantharellus anzutake]